MKNLLNISDISINDLKEIFSYADSLALKFDDSLIGKNIGLILRKFHKNKTFFSSWNKST